MLRLRRIEIENFACFATLVIEPSADEDRSLTVIRAENGSGKTTFLRAVRWGMYGEKGLPGDASRYSLHPAWWLPDEEGIKTQVVIEFETNGSTRLDGRGSEVSTLYQVVRSVTTIGKPSAGPNEPDFRRISEQTSLMVKEGDGRWARHEAGVESVVEQLLPWELRDFFVMDADEAVDFAGGGEDKVITRQEVERKTTEAVHSLLGLDIFKTATERVERTADQFGASATRAIGNVDLNEKQAELDALRVERATLAETITGERGQKADVEDRLQRSRGRLENLLRGSGAAEALRGRLADNQRELERLKRDRSRHLGSLAAELESEELLAVFGQREVCSTYEVLKPLYDSGHIPLKHLSFVRELLASGTCVCGEDLNAHGQRRKHVESRITDSEEKEQRANYLGQLHNAARDLATLAEQDNWEAHRRQLAGELAELDESLSRAELEKRDIDARLDELDEEKIRVVRDELAALESQLQRVDRDLLLHEEKVPRIDATIDSLERTLAQRQRNERAASDKRASQELAKIVVRILRAAYETIQKDQVTELSNRMNRLFGQMAANVQDDEPSQIEGHGTGLRMIAEVGVCSVHGRPEYFEIFALNSRGRPMPPTEINGASRRVLALSFVLALCIESSTQAPLVADSLLNSMSGAVRSNTLRVTAANSSQPVLLLTGADLESSSEQETVRQKAGAVYTLTGQWDASEAGQGGDVVNWTEKRQESLLCKCGPKEYCSVCERSGQSQAPGWTKRMDPLT